MASTEWRTVPKKRTVPKEHAVITPDKPQRPAPKQKNSFHLLEEFTTEDLANNKVVQRILQPRDKENVRHLKDCLIFHG